MSQWMITSGPGHPPLTWEYLGEILEQATAVDELRNQSESEGTGLYLWKLIKHTTVNVNPTVVDD